MKDEKEIEFYKSELLALRNKLESFDKIINEIKNERLRQDDKWGEQNHHIKNYEFKDTSMYYQIPSEEYVKYICEKASEKGNITWGDILIEEVVEALNANNTKDMRTELIQCGAVIIAMIESLDRNGK